MPKRSARTPVGEAKRLPISTKITPELRALLQTAADADGRTLGAEIEQRLLASFQPKGAAEDRMRAIAREEMDRRFGRELTPADREEIHKRQMGVVRSLGQGAGWQI
jgi:hypothetical protein